MAEPRTARKRRGLLRGIAVAGAVVIAAGVVACGSPGPGKSGPGGGPASTVPNGTVVMIIRHGEKPGEKKTGDESGIDDNGNPDDSSLTPTGWRRAQGLVNVFAPPSGQPRPGLARPVAIFSAGENDAGEGQRTRETVAPLAKKLGIQVDSSFGKGEEQQLIEKVTSQPGPTLICWQHGEIPAIAEALGNVTPTPPSKWPDSVYDVIWTMTKTSDGWAFAQQPEKVLPDDSDGVIEE
jgi:hypothetical protein